MENIERIVYYRMTIFETINANSPTSVMKDMKEKASSISNFLKEKGYGVSAFVIEAGGLVPEKSEPETGGQE